MNRNTALLALFALSILAGVWMFRPASAPELPPELPKEASCAGEESCSAGGAAQPEPVATEESAGAEMATEPDVPPPASPPPTPAPRPASPPVPPADGKALRAEADRLLAEGSILPGIEKLREATRADPTAKNHGDLGDLLARLTAIDEALVNLRQAAELDPGNADRWIALANAYYQAVNPGEAWKAEKRAEEAEPGLVLGRDKNGRRVRQGDSEPRKP